jgi:hypothetical protein
MTTSRSNEFGFLAGGGEMAGLIRQKDWSETPLGPIETWPSALRAALGISLNVSFPACIYWGQEMRLLYNDAWSQIPGDRHPSTLGRPAHEAWPDIWDVIGPMFNRIMDTGVAVHTEDGLLAMQRQGRTEERYFNYNVSPIHDEEGIAGLFNVVIETTDRVLAERRAELLRSLGNATYHAHSRQEICARAAGAIRDDPFAWSGTRRRGWRLRSATSPAPPWRQARSMPTRPGRTGPWARPPTARKACCTPSPSIAAIPWCWLPGRSRWAWRSSCR